MEGGKVSNVRRGNANKPASDAPSPRSNGLVYKTDSTGRQIGVRKLSALDKMRLFRVIGGENASNDRYLGLAILAASVAEIDGAPEGFPQKASQIEAMIGELDDVGTDAVTEAMAEIYGTSAEEEMAVAKK